MKKHLLSKILCLFMSTAMVFGLAACEPETTGNGDDNTGDGGDTVTYTVSFDLNGHGSPKPADQKVDKGGKATKPATDPTDDNYNFGGWYKEQATTNVFNFESETIEKDTTVYAKWTEKQSSQPPVTEPPATDTSTPLNSSAIVYVVGDSTACDYSAKLDVAYMPRYGYGTQLANYLNCQPAQIKNLALSGRSSLSFLTESNYQTLINNIKEGDYLIIGFGHNDEKVGEADRYTDPTGSYTEPMKNGSTSFQYNLYEKYVKVANEAKATPILCTPIVRYDKSGGYTGSVVHNTSTGDYAAAIRKLAEDTNTALVDLTEITKTIYKEDNNEAQYYHSHSSYKGAKPNETPDGIDTTHLNKYGAKVVAYALLKNLPEGCGLKANVITNLPAPTHESDYASAIREDYKRPDYAAPTLSNPIATIGDTSWYKTAFGDIGGDSKVDQFIFKYENETFTVGNNGTQQGKFASAGDGFGAIFLQIPVNKNFTISADATLDPDHSTPDSQGQAGFGIMLRDDMYINKGKDFKPTSNFLAVGGLGTSAVFKRESATLSSESDTTMAINATTTYHLTLTRNGQNTTVTFSDGTHEYTKNYLDFKMNLIDKEYMYICLFANRSLVANFANVQFTDNGDDTVGA